MQPTRRTFLASLCALSTATSISASPKTPQAPTDAEHAIGKWLIRWMDWRAVPNQHVKFGYWFAYLMPGQRDTESDQRHWVSPTTGVLQRVPDLGVIDTSRLDRSWPVSLLEPPEAFEKAKQRAYAQLVAVLE